VLSDVYDLIGQSLDGAERVRRIVADLKGFSHIDDVTVTVVDINAEIDRTLKVIATRYRIRRRFRETTTSFRVAAVIPRFYARCF